MSLFSLAKQTVTVTRKAVSAGITTTYQTTANAPAMIQPLDPESSVQEGVVYGKGFRLFTPPDTDIKTTDKVTDDLGREFRVAGVKVFDSGRNKHIEATLVQDNAVNSSSLPTILQSTPPTTFLQNVRQSLDVYRYAAGSGITKAYSLLSAGISAVFFPLSEKAAMVENQVYGKTYKAYVDINTDIRVGDKILASGKELRVSGLRIFAFGHNSFLEALCTLENSTIVVTAPAGQFTGQPIGLLLALTQP